LNRISTGALVGDGELGGWIERFFAIGKEGPDIELVGEGEGEIEEAAIAFAEIAPEDDTGSGWSTVKSTLLLILKTDLLRSTSRGAIPFLLILELRDIVRFEDRC